MDQEEKSNMGNEMLLAKLDELIGVIVDTRIKPRVGIDQALWNTADIADYLRLSVRHVQDNIVHHHKFPNAIRINLGKQRKAQPRWFAREVIKWAEGYQEGKAA